MKKVWFARTAGLLALLGLSYWKNSYSYKSYKSTRWCVGKSVIDWALVVLSALFCPALLVGWSVAWITRPVQSRGIQITLAVISGIALSSIGGTALEALCVLGVFSVDLLTGFNGLYGWYKKPIPESFMSFLNVPDKKG